MIDTLVNNVTIARRSRILQTIGQRQSGYALVTLHRPSNVDSRMALLRIMNALKDIQAQIPVVFPVHPRTRKNIEKFISKKELRSYTNIRFLDPMGYFDFLNLTMNAKIVLTDSGGIQEETTVLGVPCLTVRENTERPITITQGTNILVGTDTARIIREAKRIIRGKTKKGRVPKYWDGKASERIVQALRKRYGGGRR